VVGRQPLCGRERSNLAEKTWKQLFGPTQSFDTCHNALPGMIAAREAGLLSGRVGSLIGKNALGHAAGRWHQLKLTFEL
jgi:hypothetical protein